jgi:hypothetical protein
MILDFGRHCWHLLVCAMDTVEIKVENKQGNGMLMILKSFAKIHRQVRVTAVKQPQANVLPTLSYTGFHSSWEYCASCGMQTV